MTTTTQLVLGAAAYWVGKRIAWNGIERELNLPSAVNHAAVQVTRANNGELRAAKEALITVTGTADLAAYSATHDTKHLVQDIHNAIRLLRT